MIQIEEEIADVIKEYPTMRLALRRLEGDRQLKGLFPFKTQYLNYPLVTDEFEIEMDISQEYPDVLPIVKDLGHRTKGYAHVNNNLTFCLGAPLAVRKKFAENPTLLGYLREQVIPFLYSFCIWETCGIHPFGDLPHGGEGLLAFYRESFTVNSDLTVLDLLNLNIKSSRPRHPCPCGNGKRLNKCHGPQLQEMYNCQSRSERLYEFKLALDGYCVRHKKIPTKFRK